MFRFSAVETELLFDASFAFFWDKFGDFDGVNNHSIWVMDLGGRGEGVVCLVGHFGVSFCYVVSAIPLDLKGYGLFIPVIDGGGDSVHGHNVAH